VQVVMITGDNALTAVHVAREVAIVRRAAVIVDGPGETPAYEGTGGGVPCAPSLPLPA
jgi:magnesium-transporting ATPase (P-type)